MRCTLNRLRLICFISLVIFSKTLSAQQKQKIFPGADEKTASRSEYFSWINNTGEGSTE
jgi:hypothetical protein